MRQLINSYHLGWATYFYDLNNYHQVATIKYHNLNGTTSGH